MYKVPRGQQNITVPEHLSVVAVAELLQTVKMSVKSSHETDKDK